MQIGQWADAELGGRNWVGERTNHERGLDWQVDGVLVNINHSLKSGKKITQLTFQVGPGKNLVQVELPSSHENPPLY